MTTTLVTPALSLHPIDADVLAPTWRDGVDPFGSPAEEFVSRGGEQLRCCLRLADPDERLWVIGHAPLTARRPWREVGPVFVHASPCSQPYAGGDFLAELGGEPRVLRCYSRDGAMVYEAAPITTADDDLAATVRRIFVDHPEVVQVHVRNLRAQCFVVTVTC